MVKECLWYNGEMGCYELLDFDPNGLTAMKMLKRHTRGLKADIAP